MGGIGTGVGVGSGAGCGSGFFGSGSGCGLVGSGLADIEFLGIARQEGCLHGGLQQPFCKATSTEWARFDFMVSLGGPKSVTDAVKVAGGQVGPRAKWLGQMPLTISAKWLGMGISEDDGKRFMEMVVPESEPCWNWTGAIGSGGYGHFGIGSRTDGSRRVVTASRFSWLMYRGDIPDGMCVLHRCDNRRCVNPSHLFLGSIADNNSDRHGKHRSSGGRTKPNAKLTPEQVREIRAAADSASSLARRYGVTDSNILMIRAGKTWRSIL